MPYRRCVICKTLFKAKTPDIIYCSLKCRKQGLGITPAPPRDRVCPVCNVPFTPRRTNVIYCSRKCLNRLAYLVKRKRIRGLIS